MQQPLTAALLAVTLALLLPPVGARGQGAPAPAAQPVTQPAQPTSAGSPNPLRSPAHMLDYFRAAIIDAERQPQRLTDAAACLDFSEVDPEVVKEKGQEYALRLGEIVAHLVAARVFDPDDLPADPAAETRLIGKEPLLLVIERGPDRMWRFSASTAAGIPEMYQKLTQPPETEAPATESAPATEAAPEEPGVRDFLRTPRAMVEYFLVAVGEAARQAERLEDAQACMSFADVGGEVERDRRLEYAEKLGTILQKLSDAGLFKLDALPDQPDAQGQTIGKAPVLLMVTRQEDGRWQFAARTVAEIPTLYEKLPALTAPGAESEEAAARAAAAAGVPPDYRSPRATMESFLNAMGADDLRTAVQCLDQSPLREAGRDVSARVLAGKLLLVLRRHQVIVLQTIPDDPGFAGPYRVLLNRDGRVEIGRSAGSERAGEWLFTADTVRSIERLYDAWESRPLLPQFHGNTGISFPSLPALWLRENLIPAGMKRTWLWLQHWQWMGLGVVLLAGWVVHRIVRAVVPPIARRLLHAPGVAEPVKLDRRVLAPLALLALAGAWWGGIQCLDLGARLTTVVWPALRFVLVMATAWSLYRLIDVVFDYLAARAALTASRFDDVLVPLVRKTLKVVVAVSGATFMLTTVGFKIEPLLAGLGLGGLAFSFAARDTIANFFGSVNVVLDRPFQVGDWVKIGVHEGLVESVGLRSSRIRTFHDSLLTIPNAEIMNATIDNLGRRRYRRTNSRISVASTTTPQQLEALCEGIRELIRRHPHTRKDSFHVYVSQFGAASIDILLYCFHQVDDWDAELRERHRLYVDIMRLARRLGVSFVPGTPPATGAAGAEEPVSLPADLAAAAQVGREQATTIAGSTARA
jgi:MscS family membrane protein